MSNAAVFIPREFLTPDRKDAFIVWLRNLEIPSRHRRMLLQDWSELTSAKVDADDYAEVGRSLDPKDR